MSSVWKSHFLVYRVDFSLTFFLHSMFDLHLIIIFHKIKLSLGLALPSLFHRYFLVPLVSYPLHSSLFWSVRFSFLLWFLSTGIEACIVNVSAWPVHPQDLKWKPWNPLETQEARITVVMRETSPESSASAKPSWMCLAFRTGLHVLSSLSLCLPSVSLTLGLTKHFLTLSMNFGMSGSSGSGLASPKTGSLLFGFLLYPLRPIWPTLCYGCHNVLCFSACHCRST